MGNVTLPAYGTQIDVYHRNKTQDVLVLERAGSPTSVTLIIWDAVSTRDQTDLIALYAQYGAFAVGSPGTSGWHSARINTSQLTGSPLPSGLVSSNQYTVTALIGKTEQTVSVLGSTAQTLRSLASQLNARFTGVNVTLDSNNDIRFETVATGSRARVKISSTGTLFTPASSLNGFDGFNTQRLGVSSTKEVLTLNRNNANVKFSDRYNFIVRKRRPYMNRPLITGLLARLEWYDTGAGSPTTGVWRLLGTNELTGSPNTDPDWLLP